ncbi:hypothetical protein EJB05_06050 [Eragrostis curvula]|uniref:Uncharacterized protein n=1 Tax=Eragrostis curvula TaxID=38414 RepID=A0A5J9WDW6_9POAL|nr:hypothetical protein EJB05_06050 [Eragrostis curvula]
MTSYFNGDSFQTARSGTSYRSARSSVYLRVRVGSQFLCVPFETSVLPVSDTHDLTSSASCSVQHFSLIAGARCCYRGTGAFLHEIVHQGALIIQFP